MSFILEHPTRGILMELEWDDTRRPPRWHPKFSWSKPRSDAKQFFSLPDAQAARRKLADSLQDMTLILVYGTWEKI